MNNKLSNEIFEVFLNKGTIGIIERDQHKIDELGSSFFKFRLHNS